MSNIYHIIDKIPALESDEMNIEYEELAVALVKSGQLRIDADEKCNFARFSEPSLGVNRMFSARELFKDYLLENTKDFIRKTFQRNVDKNKIESKIKFTIQKLQKEVRKHQKVSTEMSLKLARLLVQSAHPIVIKWILLEGVEVFISYSHNIGDMMDIKSWRVAGQNSGMQSTDGSNAAVFVSCGGDPLGDTDAEYRTYGNGWPAIARLQVIAGQELGHYSDIMRNDQGQQVTRHSANFSATKANEASRIGRLRDIKRCDFLMSKLNAKGLKELVSYENAIKFYRKNNVGGLRLLSNRVFAFYYRHKLLYLTTEKELQFIKRFSKDRYLGVILKAMIQDMRFNLAPKADVYSHDNKDIEEAIACVEALARVPQQANKWGHLAVKYCMGDLYKIYYGEVIPSLIDVYQKVTGEQYQRNFAKPEPSLQKRLKKLWRSYFSKGISGPFRDI